MSQYVVFGPSIGYHLSLAYSYTNVYAIKQTNELWNDCLLSLKGLTTFVYQDDLVQNFLESIMIHILYCELTNE